MRKTLLLLVLGCLAAAQLLSQTEKSVTPVSSSQASFSGTTYAVVIGISDYQDQQIPDLKYAHRDAEAFANFLRSPAGGRLDKDHLQVLLNSEATNAQIVSSLDWLIDNAKEGDHAIIYFSGHGDVENKLRNNLGFLLTWDTPARSYMAGAYPIYYLQNVIETITLDKKAKVLLITDACRSGKLAGSDIGGSSLTNANLAKQFSNEIKILSCQPNEYSIEGAQWGDGRGAFSYHLVNALYGLADGNGDLFVTLQEAGRYLEDHVTAEVAPVSQVPMVLGNRMEQLAVVNTQLLADLRSGKTSQMAMLSSIESRGIEDEILAGVDSTTREMYRQFNASLKNKIFLEPTGACADAYYARLMAEPKFARLHATLTRNYAAALQDETQQVLNTWLRTRQDIVSVQVESSERLPQKVFTERVRSYPRYLERAAELLGEKHYMYANLQARKRFFEGYLLANSNRNADKALGEQALSLFRQSLKWQPDQPHVYWQMSLVFAYNFRQPDSLECYARRAMELHPNWIQPCTWTAFLLNQGLFRQRERARPYLEQASRLDPASTDVMVQWALYYLGVDSLAEAEQLLQKAAAIDSTNFDTWGNLGTLYTLSGRYEEGERAMKKALAIDSTSAGAWVNLGSLYLQTRRLPEAEGALITALNLDSTYVTAWNVLGVVYSQVRRYAENEQALKMALSIDPMNVSALNNLGFLYFQSRRYEEAEPLLKKALSMDSTNVGAWVNLGFLCQQTRRYDESEKWLKKAISINPKYTGAWLNLGYLYLQTQRYADAEPALIQAITLDPKAANARKHLGMVCFRTNRLDEARQNFLKALELNPNYAGAMLGMAYIVFPEGKTTEALSYVEQAIGKGSTFEQLEADQDLVQLRAIPEWKALMKKYFPDKVKE